MNWKEVRRGRTPGVLAGLLALDDVPAQEDGEVAGELDVFLECAGYGHGEGLRCVVTHLGAKGCMDVRNV